MTRYLAALLAVVALGGCATQAATSGRIVIEDRDSAAARIADSDRRTIENYYRNAVRKQGLPANRSNDSTPVRQGSRLPVNVRSELLPADLERLLAPPPSGYVRIRVGPDIVLLHRQTRVVADAVRGIGD